MVCWAVLVRVVKVPKGSCAKNTGVKIAVVEETGKFPINLYFKLLGLTIQAHCP